MSERPPRLVLLDGKDRGEHYKNLIASFEGECIAKGYTEPLVEEDFSCDLALVSDEFNSRATDHVCAMVKRNTPVLHVVDGVLEWRNTWENPRSLSEDQGMPLMQPVLAHKIACLGNAQIRLLESWGNLGKCELVGSSRFDALLGKTPRSRDKDEPFRLLVATARTPGFTEAQQQKARQAIQDLRLWHRFLSNGLSVRVELWWRVQSALAKELELPLDGPGNREKLYDVLPQVDGVVTTPSTLALEAMLHGLPVALLDYTNSPHYLPAAWIITAPRHIEDVIPQLLEPNPARKLYQEFILHDALACRSPATPRLERLIREMIVIGRRAKESGTPLAFPRRILEEEDWPHQLPNEGFDLQTLYPNHPVFGETDLVRMQTETGHLRAALARETTEVERWKAHSHLWQQNYHNLAKAFPIKQMLWLRRKLLGIPDTADSS